MAGRTKAAVLPLPVGADATTSRPAQRAGQACICTAVGSRHSDAFEHKKHSARVEVKGEKTGWDSGLDMQLDRKLVADI
jgi:hypothetical protein